MSDQPKPQPSPKWDRPAAWVVRLSNEELSAAFEAIEAEIAAAYQAYVTAHPGPEAPVTAQGERHGQ